MKWNLEIPKLRFSVEALVISILLGIACLFFLNPDYFEYSKMLNRPMLCEVCMLREATVHLKERTEMKGGDNSREINSTHHYCSSCGDRILEGNFEAYIDISKPAEVISLKVKVLKVTPEKTLLREIDQLPKVVEWTVLTDRLPQPFWRENEIIELHLTRMELEWLKGDKD